jgi:transposase
MSISAEIPSLSGVNRIPSANGLPWGLLGAPAAVIAAEYGKRRDEAGGETQVGGGGGARRARGVEAQWADGARVRSATRVLAAAPAILEEPAARDDDDAAHERGAAGVRGRRDAGRHARDIEDRDPRWRAAGLRARGTRRGAPRAHRRRARARPCMLTLPPGVRVFVATERTDGRKGIDGLAAIVRTQFAEDPLSGSMYVFFTRRADRVRVLYFDRDGYVLITKRLEKGSYRVPWGSERGRVVVEAAELLLVLEGIEIEGSRRRERWVPRSRQTRSSERATTA